MRGQRDVTKLFVGNLPNELTSDELRRMFGSYGAVSSAVVITEGIGGKSRGFGFVEMTSRTNAAVATKGLDGCVHKGRTLTVSHARQQGPRRDAGSRSRGWCVVGDGEHRW
jgi:RNA recognition motif-containing protein